MAQQAGTEMVGSGSGAFELCLLEYVRFDLGAFMLELTTSGNLPVAHYCTRDRRGIFSCGVVGPSNVWCPSPIAFALSRSS